VTSGNEYRAFAVAAVGGPAAHGASFELLADAPGFRAPEPLAREIARVLSDRIVFLDLAPGARLTEEEVCAAYEISRSPVREAFRILEADGLVERSARKGVRVASVGLADLHGVFKCRVALEGLAAAEAARRIGDGELATLGGLMRAMEAALAKQDVHAFFGANVAFLQTVHEATRNATLIRLMTRIERHALRYRYIAHLKAPSMLDFVLSVYREMYRALAAHDPDDARAAAERMIRRATEIIAGAVREHFPEPPENGATA
jgi:DNA-binding GntR family transcriptional regulator